MFTNRELGCGDIQSLTWERNFAIWIEPRWAFWQTITIARELGKSPKNEFSGRMPTSTSVEVAGRIREPVPMYRGAIFHVMVRFREIPDSQLSVKKFFAASSGLSRETNPDSTL